jgi:hypothetical protein
MTMQEKDFLRLLSRSPGSTDGWRNVSKMCWPLVETFGQKELIEVDQEGMRVRLTESGKTVVKFLL